MILRLLFLHISTVHACGRFFFTGDKHFALFGHVVKNLTTNGKMLCLFECLNTPQCFSINKHEDDDRKVTCELSKSSKMASPNDFKPRPGFHYLQTVDLGTCDDDICYHKAALPEGWFQIGSKIYKFFPERKTWEQARQVCQAEGGELVTIGSERENRFVFEMFAKDKTNASHPDSYRVIAHWKLDGNDTDITLVNGAEYRKEGGRKYLYLNGSGEYATTPARNFRDESFTLASWVKLLVRNNEWAPVYSIWPPTEKQFLFMAGHNGKVFFAAVNSDGGVKPLFETIPPPIDTWFHAAVVWDRARNEVYIHVNGTKVGTEAVQANWFIKDRSHTTHDIGYKRDGGELLNGYLGDLTVFGNALNEDDIRSISDDYPKNRGVWIGLNDINRTGSYHWSANTGVAFTKWASGQPDQRYNIQHCVTLMDDGTGYWEDINCDHKLAFICQKNA